MLQYILSKNTSAFETVTQRLRKNIERAYHQYSNVVLVCHGVAGLVARRFIVEQMAGKRALQIDRIILFASPNSASDLSRMYDSISWKDFLEKHTYRHSEIIGSIKSAWAANNLDKQVAVKYVLGDRDNVIDRSNAIAQWGTGHFTQVQKKDHWDVFKPKSNDDTVFLLTKQFLLADTPVRKTYPKNLLAIADVLNWELDTSGFESAKNDIIHIVDLLNQLTWRSRQLLCALVHKANQISYDEMFVMSEEISKTMNLTAYELGAELSVLQNQGFIDIIEGNESEKIRLSCMNDKWLVWDQLKAFCQKTGLSLRRLIVDLQFELLDSKH